MFKRFRKQFRIRARAHGATHPRRTTHFRALTRGMEVLEDRCMLASFTIDPYLQNPSVYTQ
jgi:predicted metal-dependent phosphotriesterase family hydrolase